MQTRTKTKRFVNVDGNQIPLVAYVNNVVKNKENAMRVLTSVGRKMRLHNLTSLPDNDVAVVIKNVTDKYANKTVHPKKKKRQITKITLSSFKNGLRVQHQHFPFEGKVVSIDNTTFTVEWPKDVGKLTYKWQDADAFEIVQ